ncbi:MAG: hypothetical protein Q4C87_10000 [Actinomycetaceae bacterium]|nr:hypothetical protein [Actinomycetaceae bacterium]
MSQIVDVDAQKVGQWWALRFQTDAGIRFIQAETIDHIEEMVRDICQMDGSAVGGDHIRVNPSGTLPTLPA